MHTVQLSACFKAGLATLSWKRVHNYPARQLFAIFFCSRQSQLPMQSNPDNHLFLKKTLWHNLHAALLFCTYYLFTIITAIDAALGYTVNLARIQQELCCFALTATVNRKRTMVTSGKSKVI